MFLIRKKATGSSEHLRIGTQLFLGCFSLICVCSKVSFFIEWRKWSNLTKRKSNLWRKWSSLTKGSGNGLIRAGRKPPPAPGFLNLHCSDPNCPGRVTLESSRLRFPPNNQHPRSLFGENEGKFVERVLKAFREPCFWILFFLLAYHLETHIKDIKCLEQSWVPIAQGKGGPSCDPRQKTDG